MDETQRSLALAKSDDWLLLFLAVINALSFLLSADIRFINFHDPAELGYCAFCHDFADTMIEIPRGLVAADPQVTLQLFRGDSLFRIQHQSNRLEPNYEGQMRVMEDCPRGLSELIVAGP